MPQAFQQPGPWDRRSVAVFVTKFLARRTRHEGEFVLTQNGGVPLRLGIAALLAVLLVLALACDGDGEDGPRLVFYSGRDGDDDIYIMSADGVDVRQLTDEPGRDYEPDSSPDGSTLVFASQRAGEDGAQLFLMNVDGSGVRRLTFSAADGVRVTDDYAHWAPAGRRVVFQRTTIPTEGRPDADIWMIDVETGEETRLTDTPEDWDSTPSFAADGSSVLFESNRDGDFDIYRLDIETMSVVQLTDEHGIDTEAKESPDGTRIAFSSVRDGDFELYVMGADGGNVRPLTDNDTEDRCPQWSPDGKRLSFYSERDGDREIYVMDADGSGAQRLTDSPGNDEVPDWVAGH